MAIQDHAVDGTVICTGYSELGLNRECERMKEQVGYRGGSKLKIIKSSA